MLPKLFEINGFFLPTYGLLVTIGFLSGLWLASRLARREGLDSDKVVNLGIWVALAGLAGAKLLMFLLDIGYYANHPEEILSLSTLRAGGIFYGGLVAALLVAFYYIRRQGLPALTTADVFAPGVALGHAIGRLGCFAAGCCWGAECSRPWAVRFTDPEANRIVGVPLGVPLHPTQLYEAAAEAAICAFLWWRMGRPRRPGTVIGLYLALYGITRFLVEFVRTHDQENPILGPYSLAQWISLALAAAGALLAARRPAPVLTRSLNRPTVE